VGLGGILHFADADGDGRRGAGEPVWAETDAGAGAVSLSWNDSGCLTADGRRVYAWSADCRLQHTETATDKVEFLYDGQGRRLAKTVTRRDAPGSPVATFYVWDGWTVVEEIESARDAETGVWAETVVAEYLPGLGGSGRKRNRDRRVCRRPRDGGNREEAGLSSRDGRRWGRRP
jgi:YD repeat-containing protein